MVVLCRDTAEAAFRARLEELGATLLEERWLGSYKPHRVRCAAGHECRTWPSGVSRSRGICRTCGGKEGAKTRVAAAEAAFRARVEAQGGTVLEPGWLGTNKPHRVRCALGHECSPSPSNLQRGKGICRICAGRDPAAAEVAFRARVEELGGIVLEPTWRGCSVPHQVTCAAGHKSTPRPNGVLFGQGICRTCAGKTWDTFYVVVDAVNEHLKFGVTSGDSRPRLRDHARDGFDTVLRLATGLPGDAAPELERQILAALRDAGEHPVRGREYFPLQVQALVLDLVDNHPAVSR